MRAESREVLDERRAAEEAAVQQAELDVRPLGQASQSQAASAAPRGSVDKVERLQKLADLHDRGALTDAEFADQKAKVLSEGQAASRGSQTPASGTAFLLPVAESRRGQTPAIAS